MVSAQVDWVSLRCKCPRVSVQMCQVCMCAWVFECVCKHLCVYTYRYMCEHLVWVCVSMCM